MEITDTKKCARCGEVKPLPAFRKRSKGNSYQSWCRKCEYIYTNKEAPNSYWTKLKSNLRRHYGDFNVTVKELKETLGEPEVCYICGGLIENREDAELDHVVPLSKGGKTDLNNLRWTHKTCNRVKHDMSVEEMLVLMRKILEHHNQK